MSIEVLKVLKIKLHISLDVGFLLRFVYVDHTKINDKISHKNMTHLNPFFLS